MASTCYWISNVYASGLTVHFTSAVAGNGWKASLKNSSGVEESSLSGAGGGDYTLTATSYGPHTIEFTCLWMSSPSCCPCDICPVDVPLPNGPCGQPTCYACSGNTCVQDNANGPYTTSNCNSACTTANNYGCYNGQCLAGYGSLPAGCNNTCIGTGTQCTNCDLTLNYCIAGNCIPKTYVVYGTIGLGAMFLLSMFK